MSARTTGLVIERELREALRRKGIWALIALVFLGSTAAIVLPSVLSGHDEKTVALVGDDEIGVTDALTALDDLEVTVKPFVDRDTAAIAVEDGDADVAVVLGEADAPTPVLLVEDDTEQFVGVVRGIVASQLAVRRLADAGIDREAVADAFASATPTVELVDVDRADRQGTAFALSMVMYLLIVLLTSQVASGVAIEKSNSVSEVLLAIVPPRSMLIGKVVGVGCIGLLTLLAGAVPLAVKLVSGGSLPEGIGGALAASGAWLIGGLALYLTLAGALGALVSRQEEAGSVVTPLVMILVAGYIVSISAADTPLGAALAYVPLLSPMIEPYRIAIGAGSPIEYALSLAILLASVVVVARVGAVVFRRAIVRTGRRLKLRDVLGRTVG